MIVSPALNDIELVLLCGVYKPIGGVYAATPIAGKLVLEGL